VTLKPKVNADEETREHAYPEVLNAIDLEQRRRDSEAKAIALGVSPRVAAKWFRPKEEK